MIMRLSIVMAVLDSHEIVRRQIEHFRKMNLPDDVEIIFVDDGSEPPLENNADLKNFTIHATNDKRPWTQPIARNTGVRLAKGEYVTCTDIDHILSKQLIIDSVNCKSDVLRFKREFGILDGNGNFSQDKETLRAYGLQENRMRKGLRTQPHSNSYTIKRSLFLELGGSREDRIMFYPNRDEVPLKVKLKRLHHRGKITIDEYRPTIYVFPTGRFCGDVNYNPFGLFHDLKRDEYPDKQVLQDNAKEEARSIQP